VAPSPTEAVEWIVFLLRFREVPGSILKPQIEVSRGFLHF